MVHFADVHPETLFLYDPVAHKSLQLYPPKNDPFRDDFSTRLEKVIDQKQCAENNWACEADRFATVIDSTEVSDETKSLAFRASFETEGFVLREQAESSGGGTTTSTFTSIGSIRCVGGNFRSTI